jgi:DNA polymerase III, epsilon subunit and related 3''-5'' exonucleases
MSERLIVFDIEVLNQDPASICAIGIVELIDLKIVSKYYSLIKPKNLSFDPYRYKVHKIKPHSLYQMKNFSEVWKEISHYFEESIVVSHDIQGDMMNLRAALKQYHIPYPHLYMSCTNVLAHLLYPHLQKYNVTDLAKMIGFDFQAHHALEDAKASAYLLMEMVKCGKVETLKELHEHYHLEFGEMKKNYYRNIISAEMAPQLLEMVHRSDAALYHQSICFTGKLSMSKELLEEKAKQVSALPTHQVSTQTNYLVIGEKGYHQVRFGKENKKVKKALKLMKQGQDLKIINEKEYIKLLDMKK